MAPLKLKQKTQVTIPAELRWQFNLQEGNYLEAEAVENGILLKSVSVVERPQTWQEKRAAMGPIHEMAPEPGQGPSGQRRANC